jgi:YidC/Oxa1 family membrane protein insertase
VNPLEFLEEPLSQILDFLHESGNLTYGWSIVVLTLMVRVALLPLVVRQYTSMRRLQEVMPQIKELQERHRGDRQKLNEEVMKFYRENNVNPLSSCLPLVFQLPIFIALYYVLRDFSKTAVEGSAPVDTLSFMWVIPNIAENITEIGFGAYVMVAVYALSQLLATELSATPNMPEMQRRMMRLLPIVIVLFVLQFPFPAGLLIYWVTTNLWTAAQQLVIRHRIGAPPTVVEATNATGGRGSRTPPKEEREAVAAAAVATEPARGWRRALSMGRRTEAAPDSEAPEPAPAPGDATAQAADAESGDGAAPDAPAEVAPATDETPAAASKGGGGQGQARSGGGQGPPRRRSKKKGGRRRAPKKR